ncbi:MAG: phage head closure protein [Rhizobiales bacterium]|nr:phage head closure protein [Hyphomicrobiales bacterium]
MRAGNLRKNAQFQTNITLSDGMGGVTDGWATQFTQRARLSPVRGKEKVEGGDLTAQATFKLTVRMSVQARTVTEEWRVVIDGANYNIRSIINPDERGKALEMVVEGGVAV